MRTIATLTALLLLPGALGCSREGEGAPVHADTAATLAMIRPLPTPYHEATLTESGRLAGTVELHGPAPRPDTAVAVTADPAVCGGAASDTAVRLDGSRIADVVVWLTDARTGKPLPIERRYEIVNERCRLVPRVQGVVAGGTLNVRSLDATIHDTRFRRAATGDSLAVVSENDEGQVVPVESVVAAPALVRATCDQHPWTRGWIAVFDHPYFAVTARDGSFAMDSIPPGRYHLLAWHPRLGTLEDSVTVTAGEQTNLKLRFEADRR